jgi:hypothetical protein
MGLRKEKSKLSSARTMDKSNSSTVSVILQRTTPEQRSVKHFDKGRQTPF